MEPQQSELSSKGEVQLVRAQARSWHYAGRMPVRLRLVRRPFTSLHGRPAEASRVFLIRTLTSPSGSGVSICSLARRLQLSDNSFFPVVQHAHHALQSVEHRRAQGRVWGISKEARYRTAVQNLRSAIRRGQGEHR